MTRHDEPDFGPTTPRANDDPRRLDPPFGGTPAPATAGPAAGAAWEPLAQRFLQQYLREQRNSRRWTIFFRLMWLLVFVMVAAALFQRQATMTAPSGPHTALVEVRGVIASEGEASAEMVVGALRQAFEDTGAKAVVLRINSPGGSPVQAGIIHDEIKRLKAKHGKKLYVVVEESAASAAYYIAVAGDEIFVDKASIVGSIGVLMDGFGLAGLMDKLGVERRLLTAGDNKSIGDPFSPMSDKHRAFLQGTLDQIHQQFITVVREGRGDRLKESPDLFSGLFWNGQQAIELGLADKVGSLDFVAREVVGAEEIVDYTARENLAERLAKRFGASVGAGAVQALQGMGALR